MKRLLIVITALALFTACAKAPDEVQRENDVLDSVSDVQRGEPYRPQTSSLSEPEQDLQFDTLENIRKSLGSGNGTSNITAKSVRVGSTAAMPVYRLQRFSDSFENIGGLVKELYGEDIEKNKAKIKRSDEQHTHFYSWDEKSRFTLNTACKGEISYVYSEKEYESVTVSSCGMLVAATKLSNTYQLAGAQTLKTVDLTGGEVSDSTGYKMPGGSSVSVKQAVQSCEGFINRHIHALFTDKVSCRAEKAEIKQLDNGSFGIQLTFEYTDKNGSIISANNETVFNASQFEQELQPAAAKTLAIAYVLDASDKPAYICINRLPMPGEELEKGDRLMTYPFAVKCLSKHLAAASLYIYDSAVLEYVVTYPAKKGFIRKDENGELSLQFDEDEYFHHDGYDVLARPCWVFRDSSKSEGSGRNIGGFITVDALSGEIYVY